MFEAMSRLLYDDMRKRQQQSEKASWLETSIHYYCDNTGRMRMNGYPELNGVNQLFQYSQLQNHQTDGMTYAQILLRKNSLISYRYY
jgi:hypothetical protein